VPSLDEKLLEISPLFGLKGTLRFSFSHSELRSKEVPFLCIEPSYMQLFTARAGFQHAAKLC